MPNMAHKILLCRLRPYGQRQREREVEKRERRYIYIYTYINRS